MVLIEIILHPQGGIGAFPWRGGVGGVLSEGQTNSREEQHNSRPSGTGDEDHNHVICSSAASKSGIGNRGPSI